ncbi:RNA-guided pseudouridylation complex pseudouridine synthase subunit Cbf5 [Halolamina salifodinae]|uniref:RNA-guided pseudouridylation complex pseudouridine synthase subunit Cbf5 n=1 Tax=Halolamina salifodinae TaxID=1202767 RepID=UPI001AE6749F|nr:RNA-guided pseudouridylation complex pseudouridine synthase subunit Cbf5 [Halolamina salifodinae]
MTVSDPLRDPPGERSVEALLSFGVVNLDKPAGPSAHQVAAWVRDLADVEQAAHAGTLDPKVTGCLPTMLGDATRLAPVFLEGAKEYVAVLELHGLPPTDVEATVAAFEAEIYQKPPRKSAVVRRLRSREIYNLDLLELKDRQALLRIRCESGTYIRKLCHDLGLALGTGGHMGNLRRVGTDPFDDTDLVTLQDLADGLAWAREDDRRRSPAQGAGEGYEEFLREVVSPAERAMEHLPAVTIARSAAVEVAEGAPVYAPGVIEIDEVAAGLDPGADDLLACYTPDGSAVCLGKLVGDPDAESGEVVSLERVLV